MVERTRGREDEIPRQWYAVAALRTRHNAQQPIYKTNYFLFLSEVIFEPAFGVQSCRDTHAARRTSLTVSKVHAVPRSKDSGDRSGALGRGIVGLKINRTVAGTLKLLKCRPDACDNI